ncbi:MAG: glycosyltransferase family A protein [Terracidiphilus sp.]
MQGRTIGALKHVRPLVSILVPAYNAEKWLADTLRSALAQTWDRKEIIVVDDGSNDQTLSVARSFESGILRVFTQAHQGAAATRNNALSISRGEFIQWLDADDLLSPNKIALQMEALEDTPNPRILLSGEWARFLYRPTKAEFTPTCLWSDLSNVEWLMRKMEQNASMQTATWLVSRELTEAAGPWDTRLLSDDDGEYFCRVLMASQGVCFVPGARVYYRYIGPQSLGYIGACDRKRDALWLSMKLNVDYLLSICDSQRARAACVRYLQNCIGAFYPERPDLFTLAQLLASDLGGRLDAPRFPWKYRWIKRVFGWRVARLMERNLQGIRWWLLRDWDRICLCLKSDPILSKEFSVPPAPDHLWSSVGCEKSPKAFSAKDRFQ